MISEKHHSEVLSEASALYGLCLALEPSVVELARNEFYEAAVISSNPTERGVREIDSAHCAPYILPVRHSPLSSQY